LNKVLSNGEKVDLIGIVIAAYCEISKSNRDATSRMQELEKLHQDEIAKINSAREIERKERLKFSRN
jgi:hypothetical protein